MIPSLAERRADIAALCRRYHVQRLDVFGSAARGDDFDPTRSDADFVVDFEPDHAPPDLSDVLALREALAALLGRPVDLAMTAGIRNPYLRAAIEQSRENIYAA